MLSVAILHHFCTSSVLLLQYSGANLNICRRWREIGLSALIRVIDTFLLIFELPNVQNIFCIRLFKK